MIDIHSHILPSLDDGASSIERSIEMAKQAVEQGITTMMATPHHQNGVYLNTKTTIEEESKKLTAILKEQGLDLSIVPGQEVRIYGELVHDFEQGDILPLNHSNYLLVEFPSDQVPAYTSQVFYDMQLRGIQPIIAHPERNRQIIEKPDTLFDLVNQGALAQLTASSLTGRFGKNIKKFSEQLIDHQLVHFLASDTHNTTSRPNDLLAAYDALEKQFGLNTVYYFQENAAILLDQQTVFAEQPTAIKKKKFLGIF